MGLFDFGAGRTGQPSAPTTHAAPTAPTPPMGAPQHMPTGGERPAAPMPAAPTTPRMPAGAPLGSFTNTGAAGPVDLATLIAQQVQDPTARSPEPLTQEEQVTQQIAALLSNPDNSGGGGAPENNTPQLQQDLIDAHFAANNPLAQMDVSAVEAAIASGENVGESLRTFAETLFKTTVASLVPIMNNLASELQSSSVQQSLTQGNETGRVQSVVTAFNKAYSYGNNPLVSNLLPNLARTISAKAPKLTAEQVAQAIHMQFVQMTPKTPTGNSANLTEDGNTDMSGLFS